MADTESDDLEAAPLVAVTGATGYVGGRLVPMLLERGYRVRCLARAPRKLEQRAWRGESRVEIVQTDLSDGEHLADCLRGCAAAYYLVHSMVAEGGDYASRDRAFAATFARASAGVGVQRIIYLGGLGSSEDDLSEHLKSRREVERVLSSAGVPVTVLRAAIVLGSGSASFEILRYLVERLPVMITPRWVQTECQPVAIIDVLHWLSECLHVPETAGQTYDIGGPEVVTYRRLMEVMVEELGLRKRLIIGVPLLTPRLSSAWISLVTPVTYKLARPLAEGLSNRVVMLNDDVQRAMPHEPLTVRRAIRRALNVVRDDRTPTRWSAAGAIPGDPDWAGGKVFVDERSIRIEAGAGDVFAAVCRVGGGHGWYAGDLLWRLRGWMDQMVGGPGLRRGRRQTEDIEYGEALDFWRVVGIERPRSLLLHAEMKLPGTARLEFHLDPVPAQPVVAPADTASSDTMPTGVDQPVARDTPEPRPAATFLTMTARFRPKGLLGILYWYAVVPLHAFVFGGMLGGIKKAAERGSGGHNQAGEAAA